MFSLPLAGGGVVPVPPPLAPLTVPPVVLPLVFPPPPLFPVAPGVGTCGLGVGGAGGVGGV